MSSVPTQGHQCHLPSRLSSCDSPGEGCDTKAGPRALGTPHPELPALTASVSRLLQTISWAWARSSSLCLSTTSLSRSITSRSLRAVLSETRAERGVRAPGTPQTHNATKFPSASANPDLFLVISQWEQWKEGN